MEYMTQVDSRLHPGELLAIQDQIVRLLLALGSSTEKNSLDLAFFQDLGLWRTGG